MQPNISSCSCAHHAIIGSETVENSGPMQTASDEQMIPFDMHKTKNMHTTIACDK